MSDPDERCAGCGALFPRSDGPTHEYIGASPGCWALFGEMSASTPMQQLMADAYAVQHPGTPSRRSIQSVAVHLISLMLQIEHGAAPSRAREAIIAALSIAFRFVWLDPPSWTGVPTIVDVRDGTDVQAWAAAVWRAWAPHHATIRAWADLAGIRP